VGIHGPGLWYFSSMKCVLMTNFKVYVWVWHMTDEFTGSWWWGKSDKILLKMWSFILLWSVYANPQNLIITQKNSQKCMHFLSLISVDSSFDGILNTKLWTIVFWWRDQSKLTYSNICFQYDCYILPKYVILIWLFSPRFMNFSVHYTITTIYFPSIIYMPFLTTQWHC
jgi:hypothetical protein